MKFARNLILLILLWPALVMAGAPSFDPDRDLISLHYDHAPDKDDGHSAAADRTILETIFGLEWIKAHTVAVSGAYGTNADRFDTGSDAVMDATWNDAGGWLAAHDNREKAIEQLTARWVATLKAGADVWVKEGGQSDITADVIRNIKVALPDVDTRQRVHVVQHSTWNENHTGRDALAYTKKESHYVRIKDANAFLNVKGGDAAFEKAALAHPVFGKAWKAAFDYYKPSHRLDYSDTGELMQILDLGRISINGFRLLFLEENKSQK